MEPLGDATRALIARELQVRYGVRVPGPSLHKQHERFHHKTHAPEMHRFPGDWVASFEVGGAVPSFLWLTNELPMSMHHNSGACCVLVEQRLRQTNNGIQNIQNIQNIQKVIPRMSLIRLTFHPKVFGGSTLIQGDVVTMQNPSRTRVFLATDLWAEAGEVLAPQVPFGDRLLRLQHLVNAAHSPNLVGDALTLRVRPYFPISQLHNVVTMRLPLDYGNGTGNGNGGGTILGVLLRSIHHGSRSIVRLFPTKKAEAEVTTKTKAVALAPLEEDPEEEDPDYYDYTDDSEDRDNEEDVTMFYVCATSVSDVYELKHALSDAVPVDIAGVPSMRDSQCLREAAEAATAIPFRRQMRFQNKWVPVRVENSVDEV